MIDSVETYQQDIFAGDIGTSKTDFTRMDLSIIKIPSL